MTTPYACPSRPPVHRVAGMQLRGRAAPLATRVYWPAPGPDEGHPPALLVLLPGAGAAGAHDCLDALARGLCTAGGLVVLALLPATGVDTGDEAAAVRDARTTLDWAADHAPELDADGDRLVVAGWASGAARVAAVARHACDEGWPPIARQVLICPDAVPPVVAADMAPATVVTVGSGDDVVDLATSGYGARLRRAGLRVDELRYEGLPGGAPGWAPWSGAADLVVADLARSLQHRLGLPPTEATRLVADDEPDEMGVA